MHTKLLLDTKEPTAAQLSNPDSIHALARRVERELHDSHLAKMTIREYTRRGLLLIVQAHEQQFFENYSEKLTNELVYKKHQEYEQGTVSRSQYQNFRKASFWLCEMHSTGIITFRYIPKWGLREPSPEFARLLKSFCDDARRTGLLTESSINNVKSGIRTFLFELESRNKFTFDGVTLEEVNDVVSHLVKGYTGGGLSWFVYCVKVFLTSLHTNNITAADLSVAVPKTIPRRAVFREGFTTDEIERLLDEPDCGTAIGKRDYAMMLLASQTGIRACDIVNLKRTDIDWHKRELSITQQKTTKPLILPIPVESAAAIADYLLNARPKSSLPYIFLCHTGVKRPIYRRSAAAIVSRYMDRAEISRDIPLRGSHSFRRSFGTRLLQNELPFDLIQQLLGQTSPNSLKPYLSVDEQGLKNCALGLVSPGKAGG